MGYQGSSWNLERLQEVYVVLLPSPAQSRLQARRLWEPSMATTAPLSSLICVDATCRIFSILSICPTSISIHPLLQRPKNALCKFQWDPGPFSACRTFQRVSLPRAIKPPIRRAQPDRLCLFSIHTHSVPTSALGSAVLCLRPPSSCVANPSPPHPDLGQAYLSPWGSAWLLLGSSQVLQAGNRSLDLYVAGIAERTLSVLLGLVTLGLAQAGLDPTPSEDSIWGLAGAGRRWEAGGIWSPSCPSKVVPGESAHPPDPA